MIYDYFKNVSFLNKSLIFSKNYQIFVLLDGWLKIVCKNMLGQEVHPIEHALLFLE